MEKKGWLPAETFCCTFIKYKESCLGKLSLFSFSFSGFEFFWRNVAILGIECERRMEKVSEQVEALFIRMDRQASFPFSELFFPIPFIYPHALFEILGRALHCKSPDQSAGVRANSLSQTSLRWKRLLWVAALFVGSSLDKG